MLCEGDNEKFPASLEYPRCFFEQGLGVVAIRGTDNVAARALAVSGLAG